MNPQNFDVKESGNYSLPEIIMFLGTMCKTEDIIDNDDEDNAELAEFFSEYVIPQAHKHNFSFTYDCKKSFSNFVQKQSNNVKNAAKALLIDAFNVLQSTKYQPTSNQSLETHPVTWYSCIITSLIEHVGCDFDDEGTALYLQSIDYACTCLSEEFKKTQDFINTQKSSHVQLLWHIALCELNEQAIAYVVGPWHFTRFLSQIQKNIDSIQETPADQLSENDKILLMEALAIINQEKFSCCSSCDDEEEEDDDDDDFDDEEDEEEEEIKPCSSNRCCKRK